MGLAGSKPFIWDRGAMGGLVKTKRRVFGSCIESAEFRSGEQFDRFEV